MQWLQNHVSGSIGSISNIDQRINNKDQLTVFALKCLRDSERIKRRNKME